MKIIKPQSALIQTIPYQMGNDAYFGVSVGVGFCLEDPRVLVHEARVWEAVKRGFSSVPLCELGMPKPHAEWLLIGHASTVCADQLMHSDQIHRWVSGVEIGEQRKYMSCRAPISTVASVEGAVAKLTVDHSLSSQGLTAENPVGMKDNPSVRSETNDTDPWSSMGPIDPNWDIRRQYLPRRTSNIEQLAKQGSHMGWPADMDRKYFMQAPLDQQHTRETWAREMPYRLVQMGLHGHSTEGQLPDLCPQVMVHYHEYQHAHQQQKTTVQLLSLKQQTIWFLPDEGIGVLWWQGAMALRYLLDNAVCGVYAAIKTPGHELSQDLLYQIALERSSVEEGQFATISDHVLMPTDRQSWTWEIIESADDHPNKLSQLKPFEIQQQQVQKRIELADALHQQYQATVKQTKKSLEKLQHLSEVILPVDREAELHWQQFFDQEHHEAPVQLTHVTIRHVHVKNKLLTAWQLAYVVFEDCQFDHVQWLEGDWQYVRCHHCTFNAVQFIQHQQINGAVVASSMVQTAWQDSTLEQVTLTNNTLSQTALEQSHLSQLTMDSCTIEGFVVNQGEWVDVAVNACQLHDVSLAHLKASNVASTQGELHHIHIKECALAKLSLVASLLFDIVVERATGEKWVIAEQQDAFAPSLPRIHQHIHITDCVIDGLTMIAAHINDFMVSHSMVTNMCAMNAVIRQAQLMQTDLQGANFNHATLDDTHITACDLQGALFYGANLNGCQFMDCNLVQSASGWSVGGIMGSENVLDGHIGYPHGERHA